MSTGNGGHIVRGSALSDLPPLASPSRPPSGLSSPDVRLTRPRRRRNWPLVILSVGWLALWGLVGWVVVSQFAAKYQVLVTTRAVPAGHVFTIGDIRPVSTSAGGLNLLQEADQDQVVGHTAAVAIPSGVPLVSADIGSATVGSGVATVAVFCKPGQFPPSLAPGDHVTIITSQAASSGSTSAGAGGPGVAQGVVVAVNTPPDSPGSGTVVTLQVSTESAPAIAQASADGRISLAVTAPGG